VLDFGRTSLDNDGLRRFKLGWGTRERRIDYFRYDPRKDRFVTARDASSGWHNHIFKTLPIPLSRLIGAALYGMWHSFVSFSQGEPPGFPNPALSPGRPGNPICRNDLNT